MSSHQSRDWWYFYTQVASVQQNLILVNKHTWQYAVGAIFMPKRKEDMKYLIEYRGEVLSGKAPDLPKIS